MDNLTHSLAGLIISKAGWQTPPPAVSLVCVVAANAPDIDFVSGFIGDRWTLLHWHRGITHSFLGTILLALIIPSFFWLGDLMMARWRRRRIALRYRSLLLASLLASVSHPLMDWTNNYGVRPFLPWNGKWFYGDLVFIVDPFLWAILGATAFLLTSSSRRQRSIWSLFAVFLSLLVIAVALLSGRLDHPLLVVGLWLAIVVGSVIYRKQVHSEQATRMVAIAGLGVVVLYWGGLALLHSQALKSAREQGALLAHDRQESVMQVAAMPTVANPNRWQCLVESDLAIYRFDVSLFDGSVQGQDVARFAKANALEGKAIATAKQDRRAQILLEFARFPIERAPDSDCVTGMLVQFADLRYTEPGKPRGSFSLDVPIECPAHP